MPDDDLLARLISEGETTNVDRKFQLNLEDKEGKLEFCKDVSAMANNYGGTSYLLVGVENKSGAAVGIDSKTFDSARMQQVVNSGCYPHVDFTTKLIEYHGKSVGLITIPPSTRKPHRVRYGTKMVTYVRRGDTTAEADTDEILSMFASSQTMEHEDQFDTVMSPAEIVLYLSVLGAVYALVRPLTFISGWSTAGIFSFDFISLVIAIAVIALILFAKFLALGETVALLSPWRRVLSSILIFQVVEMGCVFIITAFSMDYPTYFRSLVVGPWDDLSILEVQSAILSLICFLLVENRFPTYLRLLADVRPDNLRLVSWAKLPRFGWLAKISRSRRFQGILILILVSAIVIQPLDAQYGLFTPRVTMQTVPYGFNDFLPDPSAHYFLSVVGDLDSANTSGSCTVNAYQAFNETVTTYVARSPYLAVDSLTIPNPSTMSVSTSYNTGSASASFPVDIYDSQPWTQLGIANTNKSYVAVSPYASNVTAVELNVGNEPPGSKILFSMVYFEKATPPITCNGSVSYTTLPNGSALARAEFILNNHEPSTVAVEYLDVHEILDWFTNDPLNTNPRQVTLYWGNHTVPYADEGYDQVYPGVMAIAPSTTVNYTVTAVGAGIF